MGEPRLGIDFGTSSTSGVLRTADGTDRPLLFEGSPVLPSALCYGAEAGALLTGRDALHAARGAPGSFEPNPKRRIDDGTVLLGEVEVRVPDLIAAILGRVHDEAVRVAGGPVAAVTLTHPAGWGPLRREILAEAARRAALPPVTLVPEPVAAAAGFTARQDFPAGCCLAVYDFGAGTFDATVLRRTAHGYEVLATEGLADVGGLDVDGAVFQHFRAAYEARNPDAWARLAAPVTAADRRVAMALRDDIRSAKEMLSRVASATVYIPLLELDAPLGREQLDALAAPLLERTVAAVRAALAAAGVAPEELTGLYLVGGASRMPLCATMLHRALRVAPVVVEQPELAVASGSLHTPLAPPEPPTVEVAPAAEPPAPPVKQGSSGRVAFIIAVAGIALYALGIVITNKTGSDLGGFLVGAPGFVAFPIATGIGLAQRSARKKARARARAATQDQP